MSARARMGSTATRLKQTVAGGLGLLLAVGALGVATPTAALADSAPLVVDAVTPTTVTADGLPTVQVNGVVWSQVVVGNTVYAAGKFTRARPAGAAAGTSETVRNNLLAYDIRTGKLVTSFAPDLNAQAMVVTASPDGSRVYVGGDFTKANGQTRNRVAAYDTATGALVSAFKPSVSGRVRALAATNSTVYLGGSLSAVGSVSRTRLAAVQASNGALLPWAPKPGAAATNGSNEVMAMVVTNGGTQVVAGGRFATMNGVAATGVSALHATTGATRTFAVNKIITNQGAASAVWGLSTDGTTVYGSAYDYAGAGNFEGTFSATANGGALISSAYCRGDNYSSYATGGVLYIASHMHDCSYVGGYPDQKPQIFKYATAFNLTPTGVVPSNTFRNKNWVGKPTSSLLDWFPTMAAGKVTGQFQAGWSVTGNSQYVVYGGEFPSVNGIGQQGLVRYAVPELAPNKIGPATTGLTPTITVLGAGAVRLRWNATSDRDNGNLTYRVYRDGGTTPVHEVDQTSAWWRLPAMTVGDTGLAAGSHTYRVTATDAWGNVARSPWTTVEVPVGASARPYADVVRADGATGHWSLGDRSGTAVDLAGTEDMTLGTGVTRGAAGALSGDADTAYGFTGTSTSHLATPTAVAGPQTFSVEAWFKTSAADGGMVVGFSDATTGTSVRKDRMVYLDAAGKLNFGAYPGVRRSVTSTASYNDGAWHHVVATLGAGGMSLYADGTLVGSRADTTSAQPFTGYWRIGADRTWAGSSTFTGSIDEVAVYPRALSAAQVREHLTAGRSGAARNVPPVAAFTPAVRDLTVRVDATGSTDGDGTVAGWAWTFGDGGTGTGVTASHTYGAPGTYPVALTVTDDDGATSTVTRSVTIAAPLPNETPSAAFGSSATGLAVALDGAASDDPDGDIATYAWDLGDGSQATGATTSHVYAAAGTYRVQLTVTDDDGATAVVRHDVTVTAPASTDVVAGDAFTRTVSGGLGKADVGGSWTAAAGAARQSVSAGRATLDLPAAGLNTGSYLPGVSQVSADIRTSVTPAGAPTGNGTYVYVSGRRVAGVGEYRVRVRFLADGRVGLALSRLTGSTESFPGGELVVPGLTHQPGTPLELRVQVTGTGTTQVRATVWPAGAAEPATPSMTRSDTTASLQAPGAVGLAAYLPSGASATSVRFSALTVTAVP